MSVGLEITPSLKAGLAELYFKECCDQQGWAYIPLREIKLKDGSNNILIFNKGPHRISIRIMDKILPEIKEISRPLNNGDFFVFDYLACKVGQQEKYGGVMVPIPAALCWVKIGKVFSNEQADALERIRLPVAVFRIRNVLVQPGKVEIKWEMKSGQEWLNELDDQREEAESDDDYL